MACADLRDGRFPGIGGVALVASLNKGGVGGSILESAATFASSPFSGHFRAPGSYTRMELFLITITHCYPSRDPTIR